MTPTLFVALTAGLLSFLSPCVLPLVPAYIAILSKGEASGRLGPLWRAILFSMGFTFVFILLGLGASAIGQYLGAYRPTLEKIGGLFVIVLGLHQLGVLRLTPLYRERRLTAPRGGSAAAAVAIGMVFAFGWTPCVGPVLAGILTLAGTSGRAAQGVSLLAAYSAGLALPFLLAAVGYGWLLRALRALGRYGHYFEMAGGALLILLGLLLVSGRLEILTRLFS